MPKPCNPSAAMLGLLTDPNISSDGMITTVKPPSPHCRRRFRSVHPQAFRQATVYAPKLLGRNTKPRSFDEWRSLASSRSLKVDDENRYGDDRTLLGNDDPGRWPNPKPKPVLVCSEGELVRGE